MNSVLVVPQKSVVFLYGDVTIPMMSKFYNFTRGSASQRGEFRINYDYFYFDVLSKQFTDEQKMKFVTTFLQVFAAHHDTGDWKIVSISSCTLTFESASLKRAWNMQKLREASQRLRNSVR